MGGTATQCVDGDCTTIENMPPVHEEYPPMPAGEGHMLPMALASEPEDPIITIIMEEVPVIEMSEHDDCASDDEDCSALAFISKLLEPELYKLEEKMTPNDEVEVELIDMPVESRLE